MRNEKTGVYQKYLNSLKEGDKVQAQFLCDLSIYKSGDVLDFNISETTKDDIYCKGDLDGIAFFIYFLKESGKDELGGLQIVVPVEFVNQHM